MPGDAAHRAPAFASAAARAGAAGRAGEASLGSAFIDQPEVILDAAKGAAICGSRRVSYMTTYKWYDNAASAYMQYLPELTARQFADPVAARHFETVGSRCSYFLIAVAGLRYTMTYNKSDLIVGQDEYDRPCAAEFSDPSRAQPEDGESTAPPSSL
jgi:hypothetical protein